MCGVTQINPSDLRAAIEELTQKHLLTHTTGFEKQFKVCFLTKVCRGAHDKQLQCTLPTVRQPVYLVFFLVFLLACVNLCTCFSS